MNRRELMVFLGFSALSSYLCGCGGGNGNNGDTNDFIYSSLIGPSSPIDVYDPSSKIKIYSNSSVFFSESSLTITITNLKNDNLNRAYTFYNYVVGFQIDISNIKVDTDILIDFPWVFPFSSIGTSIFISDASRNKIFAIPTDYNGDDKTISTKINESIIKIFCDKNTGVVSFDLIAGGIDLINENKPVPSRYKEVITPKKRSQNVGLRVAVLVHGLRSHSASMQPLKSYLNSNRFKLESTGHYIETAVVYDKVLSFEYGDVLPGEHYQDGTYRPIADSGRLLADWIRESVSDAEVVDTYAYSMGGLVSRWAIEKEGLGDRVRHLVMLGTPNLGVPLQGVINYLYKIIPSFISNVKSSAQGAFELVENSDFLTELNRVRYNGPTVYHTVGGTKADALNLIGPLITFIYGFQENDGVVPLYSAKYSGLDSVMIDFNHFTILSDVENHNSISRWIIGSLNGEVG